ncbi:MAG: arsenic metallochaperone ArsD family protein, partial [Candidatus Nanopelagicales bacterium]
MPVVRVYEPALCCNTGVCGEDVDQALVTFTADLTALA